MPTAITEKPRLVLVLACLVLFLPGFFNVGPVDRDESRYAQASKQMLETGNFVEIYFQEDARNKKPIGIYWMQAASASLFGGVDAPIWAYRLPSLLGAIGAVLITFWAGARWLGPVGGFTAGLALASSLLLVIEAHLAKTDAMLLLAIATSQICLGHFYVAANGRLIGGATEDLRRIAILFWIALGAGILIKGPIGVLIGGLTIITLAVADRSLLWLKPIRPLLGLAIVVAITAPWVIAITLSGSSFFSDAVGNDLLPKLMSGQESHGSPPGTYAVLAVVTLWPASLVLGPALWFGWQRNAHPIYRFCLAWILPSWLLFELVPTKLPHYILPMVPAIALIIGGYLTHLAERGQHISGEGFPRFAWSCWLIVSLVLIATPISAAFYLGTPPPIAAWIFLGLALATVLTVHPRVPQLAPGAGLWRAVIAAFFLYAATFQITLPALQDLNLSRQIYAAKQEVAPATAPLASTGYAEPSLVFLNGTETALLPPERVAAFLADTPDAIAVVEQRQEEVFQKAASDLKISLRPLKTLSGYNYSVGKDVTFTLYEKNTGGDND